MLSAMDPKRVSQTALLVTLYRALDVEHLEPPVLGDAFAARLLSVGESVEYESAVHAMFVAAHPDLAPLSWREALREGCRRNRAKLPRVLLRARFADDVLETALARGTTQCVIVGAGLDTFVFRRPDLARRVATFEVDHPATQVEKRRRLARAGLEVPAAHHFAACDLESEDIARALAKLPFDASAPTFFAWLGVVPYLTHAAIEATLRSIRRAATRCDVVFDYVLDTSLDRPSPSAELRALRELLVRYGEPILSGFEPAALREQLASLGFEVVRDTDPEILHEGYARRPGESSVGRLLHARAR